MNKLGIFTIIITLAAGLTACVNRRVVGSGVIASEKRLVSNFNEVSLAGVGTLTIEQGDRESLTIEAEDNILPYIDTKVVDSRLTISFKAAADIFPTKPIRYQLTMISLDSINLSGAGDIDASDIDTDLLEVTLSGAGRLTISGTADRQEVTLSGLGNYNAENLVSTTAMISLSGAGSAKVQVSDHLEATISGAGSVGYIGDPEVESNVSGLGSIKQIEGD